MWVMMILLPSTLTFDVPCVKRCNSTDLPKDTCDKETYKLVCEVYNEIIDLKYEIKVFINIMEIQRGLLLIFSAICIIVNLINLFLIQRIQRARASTTETECAIK